MKQDKPLIDLTANRPVVHLHIHASDLRDLTFAKGVLDIINGVDSDDSEFVKALSQPVEYLPAQGSVQ